MPASHNGIASVSNKTRANRTRNGTQVQLLEWASYNMEDGISLCMIVKNEEGKLRQCLESIKELVDEIIIVDTGSTDKTKDIAKEFTNKAFNFDWNDDFSAARNFCISKATREWILSFDADEKISEMDFSKIKELMKIKEADAFLFSWRNYHDEIGSMKWVSSSGDKYPESKIAAGYNADSVLRFFRNGKGYHFQGIIHETVHDTITSSGGKIFMSDVAIHHFGALDKIRDEKRQRNIDLLKKRIEERDFKEKPEDCILFELAKMLIGLKKYAEAIPYLERAIEIKEDASYLSSLGGALSMLEKFEEAEKIFRKAVELDPKNPSNHMNLGVIYARQKNYEKAVRKLEKAIELNPGYADSYYNLGRVYQEKGKKEKARFYFEQALELNPNYRSMMK